jgi:exopolyphosphatase / guanosine-5'-triphosphate,3'-diphosphate pyrophosphatase
VARYHRGGTPKRKHETWWRLDRESREKVRRLSALLRVADGFDRGHASAVDKVKVRWLERAVRLTPTPRRANDPMRLELWGAARKAGLLEEVAGVLVEVVAPDGTVVPA